MPKRRHQVGEEELSSGLKGFGNLDQITEHKPRRDSPFRDTRETEQATAPERKPEKVVAMRPAAAEPVAVRATEQASETESHLGIDRSDQAGSLSISSDGQRELLERARAARERTPPQTVARPPANAEHQIPNRSIKVETRPAPRTIEEAAREVRVLEAPEAESNGLATGPRKADLYSERVTLLMSSEMRDRIEALAKELQRRKTSKSERITSNTVMRVALKAFLETFELHDGEVVNTEEEFERLVRNE